VLSRFRRADDGSVAVLAAVTFPVVLLCVALALAAMVWASSEHETQRAADAAAVRAAATAFLGTDYPYQQIPGITDPVTYPSIEAIADLAGQDAPDNLDECGTVGLPRVDPLHVDIPDLGIGLGGSVDAAVGIADALDLPVDCSPVGPYAPPPALGMADQSRNVACETAREAMARSEAPMGNKFYSGTGDAQPSCPDRIKVKLATGSPLVGFGQYAADSATGALDTQFVPQLASVRTALAAFGIRLDTSLPSLICPEISVGIDQPVREPVFDRASVPNGRATARRVVKNAVVVPVFEGQTIAAAAGGTVTASVNGAGVTVSQATGGTVTIPPQNLNALLIDAQAELLTLLEEVDAIADAAVKAADVTVDQLNGVFEGIDVLGTQPPTAPGAEPLDSLRLTKCLRDTLTQVYDPPSGDAPTAEEVLADAAETGEQVVVVQVGAVEAACTEPGAIPYVTAIPEPTLSPACIRAATAPQYNPLNGLYEVPFFDATPVLVQDIGEHNFAAVPVHASQAAGAFRAALVRDADNERYDPDVRQPKPTPVCDLTVPLPTPSTACEILEVTPSPSLPVPTPEPTLPTVEPTLPTVEPTVPTIEPTLPTIQPTLPTVSPTCLVPLLCGGG